MTRKAALVAVDEGSITYRRGQNRAARHERREEIEAKWNARVASRLFERGNPFTNLLRLIDDLVYYGQWASRRDLLLGARWLDDDGEKVPIDTYSLVVALVRIIELKELSYDEYLKTAEWRARANRAKSRYSGKCALDATHEAQEAHHRTYQRRGREYDDDLIPLCRSCHEKFHGKDRR